VNRQTRSTALALTAVLFWATVATAFKLTLRWIGPVDLLLVAAPVSTLALGLGLLRRRPSLRRLLRPKALAMSALLGLLNPFLYYLVLFEAYDRLPGQVAQPLNYTWAITLTLLSVLVLKQRIRAASWLGILISFLGVLVLSTRGDLLGLRFDDPLGVGLALFSSIFWALYWILNLRDGRGATEKLFLGFVFGTIYVWAYAASRGLIGPMPIAGLIGGAYVGLFEMGLTFLLWMKALESAENTARVSNLIFLSPFVSLVLLAMVAGESILPSSVLGLALIIGGIAVQRRWA